MHTVYGFPVNSTWLKSVKAGNYMSWPLLTEKSVAKYYPKTIETPKGHIAGKRPARRPLIMPFIDWKTTTYQLDLK